MIDQTTEKYISIIKKRLSEKRFIHSINVSKEAMRLAYLYGADEKKAEIAGLLHDITKEAPTDDQKQFIKEHGGERVCAIDSNTKQLLKSNPKLLHSISGMLFLKDVLKIEDEDILNAVLYHTTARAGMSILEKVLYIADFTSAERDYDGVEKIREMSNVSLESVMIEGLSFAITELTEKKSPIAINTILAYNEATLEMGEASAE